jgi:hypothetical protein
MGEPFSAQIDGDNQTSRFELPEFNLDQVIVYTQADTGGASSALGNGTDYTLDPFNGLITLNQTLSSGTLLVVTGVSYETWPDADLTDYITQALEQHNVTRNPPVLLDPVASANPPTNVLPVVEERAVALLAASLVQSDAATAAAKDITIDTGDGTVIPRAQRYNQLTQEAARLEGAYVGLCEKMGIPCFATATVGQLRRVSMTTNRLVPEYVPREWDDRSFPKRVLPLISTYALEPDSVINYRGLWNPAATYRVNDLVDRSSTRYLCTTLNSGIDPIADVAAGGANGVDNLNGQHWTVSYINSGNFGWVAGGW